MTDFGITVDRTATPARLTFASRFNVAVPFIDRHLAEGRADKPAIVTASETISYARLAEQVDRAGRALLNAGLVPGDRVLMVVKDCPAFIYVFWGAIKTGLVPAPVNTLLRGPDYAYIIGHAAPAALIYSPEFAGEVEAGLAATDHTPALIVRDGDDLDALMSAAAPALDPAPATADADCFWLFSSGSTGRPKATIHRHRDMVVTSEFYGVGCLGMNQDDIFYSAAKLFFAYGLGNAMTFPLWVGGTAVLDPARPTPDTTFANIARFGPTLYFGVPTLYAAQLQALETAVTPPQLDSLRACVSAGEALPGDLLRRWHAATDLDILDGIGSTEALHIFISNRLGDITPGTSGRLVPGYRARIVDENDKQVADGTAGRLLISGPSTAAYYWQDDAKTAATMRGNWLDTGDTYTVNPDGTFVYGGRSDDMMKVGGIWCSPFEIEARLIEHPNVLEAAVVGREDENRLVKPAAYVIPAGAVDSLDDLRRELMDFVKAGLAPYKYPRWISFVDTLPKTATGKIQRFKLRQTDGDG